jgi:hypothetical protein
MTDATPSSFRIAVVAGVEYGPVDLATLERWTREARVTKATMVWSSSDNQWRAAGERRELDAAFAAWLDPNAPPIVGPPVNAQAVWSFALAQFGLCCCFPAIPAIICGFISLSQIRRRRERGRALAISGIILGFASVALGVLSAIYVWLVASMDPATQQQLLDSYVKMLQGK